MRDHTYPATAFHAVALVAAARTALHTARSVADRRAGRDPSGQEPEAPVRVDLGTLSDRLAGLGVRLQLRAITGTAETEAAAFAQAFEDRLLLDEIAQDVRRAHQKLMSLYPAVSHDVVEDARQLAADAAQAAHADPPETEMGPLARRIGDWLDAVREALA